MRSKTFMSKINLQRGKLTVENRKSREKNRAAVGMGMPMDYGYGVSMGMMFHFHPHRPMGILWGFLINLK